MRPCPKPLRNTPEPSSKLSVPANPPAVANLKSFRKVVGAQLYPEHRRRDVWGTPAWQPTQIRKAFNFSSQITVREILESTLVCWISRKLVIRQSHIANHQ